MVNLQVTLIWGRQKETDNVFNWADKSSGTPGQSFHSFIEPMTLRTTVWRLEMPSCNQQPPCETKYADY
jgi:hypothetical protein